MSFDFIMIYVLQSVIDYSQLDLNEFMHRSV